MKKNQSLVGYRLPVHFWSVERMVFLVAGIFIVISLCLGMWWSRNFFYLSLFVGGMLIQFSLSGYCPLASIVRKVFKLPSLSENGKKFE